MLHRVEVQIVDASFQVFLVSNGVFPEPALPDAVFIASLSAFAD